MFDCGGQYGHPQVQPFSLNTPDLCRNTSTVYVPPVTKAVQVIQIPDNTPIQIHNCLIETTTSVGYCGNTGFSHAAHARRTIDERVLYPSSLECMHAVEKDEMQFTVPKFGMARAFRITVPLTQGVSNFEEFSVGYSTIDSDCRGQPFQSPAEKYVAKAVVRVEGKIRVTTQTAKLINNRASLVITVKIIFDRSNAETKHIWQPKGKSVVAKIYADIKNEYEYYTDPIFGVFVANKSHIPENTCETARRVWS